MRFVFDFGGVLVRWQPAEVLRRALPARAHDEASTERWVRTIFLTAGGGWADFDRGVIDVPTLVARLVARTELSADEVQALVEAVPEQLRPIAPTIDLLDRLRRVGEPLYFLSNMPRPYVEHVQRSHAFVGWFADGVFSSQVGLLKPEAAIYCYAARRFGVPAAELVFIDDHAPNVEAARDAGWQAVQFRDARSCEQELRQAGWWPAAA